MAENFMVEEVNLEKYWVKKSELKLGVGNSGVEMFCNLVKSLQNYMPVDIYGDCGTHKCPDKEDCLQYISDNYKFYISFENSLCKDYVTEKFFQAMSHDILPIVYGGTDYSEIAPPKSYINVLPDFEKPNDLASFLTVRII